MSDLNEQKMNNLPSLMVILHAFFHLEMTEILHDGPVVMVSDVLYAAGLKSNLKTVFLSDYNISTGPAGRLIAVIHTYDVHAMGLQ